MSGQFNTSHCRHYGKGFQPKTFRMTTRCSWWPGALHEPAATAPAPRASARLAEGTGEVGEQFTVLFALGAEGQNKVCHHEVTVSTLRQTGLTAQLPMVKRQQLSTPGNRHAGPRSGARACNGKSVYGSRWRGMGKNPLALRAHNGTRNRNQWCSLSPGTAELPQAHALSADTGSSFVLSPITGLLLDLAVQLGQKVRKVNAGTVIEAMKMENILLPRKMAWSARSCGQEADRWR